MASSYPGMGRRAWRRLRRLVRGPAAAFVYHADYRRSLPGVPLDPLRGERILAFLLGHGWIRRADVSEPIPAAVENLARVHPPGYLRTLDDADIVGQALGVPLDPEGARRAVEVQRLMAGGTIQATRLALESGTGVHLGGGLHHAEPERGLGYCLFNDVAVAVARLRARRFDEPILVVDLDIHDGNGTRAAFAADATVHTFSIHNAPWDERRAVADTSLALGEDVEDDTYLAALRSALPPVLAEHQPGFVVYIAGADPAADDALGNWRITARGLLERDRFVTRSVRAARRRVPFVVLLGGGYGNAAWRYPARYLAWLLTGRAVEPPDDVEAAVDRIRWILEDSRTDAAPAGWLDWTLVPDDIGVLGPGEPAETRLLGRFDEAGLRRTLERVGILEQLRALGYGRPVVELAPESALGSTVRVFGGPDRRELLIELRLSRDTAAVPGMALLWVEWLLLQNPRAEFTPDQPRLPGQSHPGLGILPDVLGWWVALCEELRLDGIGFRTSHYHIAALGARHLRFLDPEDGARFEAVRSALRGLPLADAIRALHAHEVRDPRTGEPVRWNDAAMVLPVSDRLRRLLDADSRTDEAAPERPADDAQARSSG